MQSSNVPCLPGTLPWLRGTISYQAPERARSRSATSGTTWLRVRSGRVSVCVMAVSSFSSSSSAPSPVLANFFAAASATWRALRARGINSPKRCAPSCASSVTSCPACCLRWNSLRQVANWSVQASSANRYQPGSGGVKRPCQRSFECSTMGSLRHSLSRSGRHSSAAAMTSWPSRKISAQTSTVSPAMRLTA